MGKRRVGEYYLLTVRGITYHLPSVQRVGRSEFFWNVYAHTEQATKVVK